MMIVVSGMISVGKSSVSKAVGEALGLEVFYESVDDNPILPLFYTSTPEEQERNRYPFLLQLHFLYTRFNAIKQAIACGQAILDRSLYEDYYFAKINHKLGRISDLELQIYEGILASMMEEIKGMPKKAPDLNIYLKASFDTVMERLHMRGREFEQDESLVEYYRLLWAGYDDWVNEEYKASDVLIIDMDKLDVVHNQDDHDWLIQNVKGKLETLELKTA